MKSVLGGPTVPDESTALTAAACLFHGFSDPSRLAIVRRLALGEHRVVDLTDHLGLAQSTVSKHLACLKDCGLVASRPEGRASMWSLNHTDTVLKLLSAAEGRQSSHRPAPPLCGIEDDFVRARCADLLCSLAPGRGRGLG